MAPRFVHVRTAEGEAGELLRGGIEAIRTEQKITPDFPAEVTRAARAAGRAPRLPDLDRTDLPFVTLDPATSRDLDQAMHLERDGDGYVVHYAIADLAAFVTPGDPVDLEAHRRGETLYAADSKVPLHPPELSEDAASLLPGQVRPAVLWTLRLDATGELAGTTVERARIRSRAKLDYASVQRSLDDGAADPMMRLLREVGERRQALESARGGVNLPRPQQEVRIDGDTWALEYRRVLPVEDWNAQISLLTGFAAGAMMVYGQVGVLRTLPPAEPEAVRRLHRTAAALGVPWPAEQSYPDFVRGLDSAQPAQAAMLVACTSLLRGAAYVAFDGQVPEQPEHAALASEYAHCTAPLRRLVDRYAQEVCLALSADRPVPEWVRATLPGLPATMRAADHRAHAYENAVLDLVEAVTLRGAVGRRFPGVVLERDKDGRHGSAMVTEPAIEAPVASAGDLPVGERVTLTLAEADPATRTVRFTL